MNKVTCPICNREMLRITGKHIAMHDMTLVTFTAMFPQQLLEDPLMRAQYGSQSSKTRETIRLVAERQKMQRVLSYESNPTTCTHCGTALPYQKKRNTYCSHSCRASHMNNRRVISSEAQDHIRQVAKLNADRLIKYARERCVSHTTPKYTKIYHNTCHICSTTFFTSNQHKKTCSAICRSSIHAINNHKQNTTSGKCGWYRGIWCASSWELAFVVYNIEHLRHSVQRFDGHFVYQTDKQHRYFPDFIVNGTVYEIKGRWDHTVQPKLDAAAQAGCPITLIQRADITPMIHWVKQQFEVRDITDLYSRP